MKIKKNDKLFTCLLTINALFLLLIFTTANVFADFYVIAGSRGVGTKITALPYIIASPGFYYIDKDLPCPAQQFGIIINADNVTLDLMGFSLIGPGGSSYYDGILMDGRTNVEIRNGTIRNFSGDGISDPASYGIGHRIINVRLKGNDKHGINLASKGNLIERCTAVDNGSGIYASDGSTVTGNTCYINNSYGIYAGSGSVIIGNTCYSNTTYGIYLRGNSLVDQNSSYNNGTNLYDAGFCSFGSNHFPALL